MKDIGEQLKARRLEMGLTLREFCKRYYLDAVTVSRLERGLPDETSVNNLPLIIDKESALRLAKAAQRKL